MLGLGAGWQPNEHLAYGFGFPGVRERLERLDEACHVIKRLFGAELTTFAGKHYQLVDAPFEPKPAGPLPLLVGGGGEKTTMRIAATYADEWNTWGTPSVMARKCAVLDRHCESMGRNPASISRSAQAIVVMTGDARSATEMYKDRFPPERLLVGSSDEITEQIAGYRRAGVEEFIVPDLTLGGPGRREEAMDRFIAEVAAHFRP